jgi:hypothetical protein
MKMHFGTVLAVTFHAGLLASHAHGAAFEETFTSLLTRVLAVEFPLLKWTAWLQPARTKKHNVLRTVIGPLRNSR